MTVLTDEQLTFVTAMKTYVESSQKAIQSLANAIAALETRINTNEVTLLGLLDRLEN